MGSVGADAAAGLVTTSDVIVAVCWATIDLERSVADAELMFSAASRDALLGARAASAAVGSSYLLIEEPDTEGRLAAHLARFGEGVAAVYVESAGPPFDSPATVTPLGRQGLLRTPDKPWGPFVIELRA